MTTEAAATPAPAPDYTRPDDGATMREVYPGEFVNLEVLRSWGFKVPAAPSGSPLNKL